MVVGGVYHWNPWPINWRANIISFLPVYQVDPKIRPTSTYPKIPRKGAKRLKIFFTFFWKLLGVTIFVLKTFFLDGSIWHKDSTKHLTKNKVSEKVCCKKNNNTILSIQILTCWCVLHCAIYQRLTKDNMYLTKWFEVMF